MRDFKNMKRQRGRNRSSGGGGNSGGKPQQNANRAFDSNGPDNVKIRGHAQHVFEKYQQYARDAFSSGDRVLAENYLQHADHYFRVLRTIQPQRSPSEILGRDVLASGLDIDFEEEFESSEDGSEGQTEVGQEGNGDGRREERYEPRREGEAAPRERADTRRDGYEGRERNTEFRQDRYGEGQSRLRSDGAPRDRNDGSYPRERNDGGYARERNEGQYRDRQDGRERNGADRNSADRNGADRSSEKGDRPERQDAISPRRDSRSFDGRRDERGYGREPREARFEERRPDERRPDERRGGESSAAIDPLPVVEPLMTADAFPVSTGEAEMSPVLRSEDGGMSEAPAFLQQGAGEDGEQRKPRARRRRAAPRSFEVGEGDAGSPGASSVEAEET